MTAVPVSAAVIRDRAEALHASTRARDAHRAGCTRARCASCTRMDRAMNAAYQSAVSTAATVRSER